MSTSGQEAARRERALEQVWVSVADTSGMVGWKFKNSAEIGMTESTRLDQLKGWSESKVGWIYSLARREEWKRIDGQPDGTYIPGSTTLGQVLDLFGIQ